MKKTILFIICIITTLYSSNVTSEEAQSIQWQRIALEQKLKKRLSGFLELIISNKKFFVEVEVKATTANLSVPNFKLPKRKSSSSIKFSNKKFRPKKGGEQFIFDKLGLMAPLYEQTSNQENQDLQIRFFQYKKRIENTKILQSDLFQLIEGIKVKLVIDQSISNEQQTKIKKLMVAILPTFGKIAPSLEILKVNFLQEKHLKSNQIDKYISSLSTPVGIIIATFIFCLSSLFIFSGYKRFKQKTLEDEKEYKNQEDQDRLEDALPITDEVIDPMLRPGSPQLIDAISSQDEGVKRLFLYLDKSYLQACNLIKKWINLDSSLSNTSLIILSERMTIDELYKVFAKLSLEERDIWIKLSTNTDTTIDLKNQADRFIAQQVLEDIMTVSSTNDDELQKLLIELSPLKAASIAKKNLDHAAILVNLMGTDFLGQMYTYLNKDEIIEISSKGLSIKDEEINESCEDLKLILKNHVDIKYINPFSRKISEVIHKLGPLQQEDIINVLMNKKHFFILKDIVRNIIPISTIEKLPPEIIKTIFKKIPRKLQTEFLTSLDDKKRTFYINSISSEGSKGRDVIEFEINKNLENKLILDEILRKKDEIFASYITFVRKMASENEQLKSIIAIMIQDWIKENESESRSIHLQEVA